MESVDTSQGHIQHSKKGGGGNPGNSEVYKACTAENGRKIGVKSTVLELQKSFKHKSSSLNNFQKNEPD